MFSTVLRNEHTSLTTTVNDGGMRLPAVLSPLDLPEQELVAACLDGELQRVADAFCAIDAIIGSEHRASSIGAEAPKYAIAERRTAAWIYGAALHLDRPLQLCVDARTKVHPLSTRLVAFREVVIRDEEIVPMGGLSVTTPLRTALDIARFSGKFLPADAALIRRLAELGSFQLEDCTDTIAARRNLPNKRVTLSRLAKAFDCAERSTSRH